MARSTAGLTEPDIAELRRQLADGKRPRVQLSGPHFPAGAAGTVVRIGSPDTDGADYLRVRVKVNGMLDELAFAPGELSLRRPGRATKATAARRPAKASGTASAAGTTTASRTAKAAGTASAAGTTTASRTAKAAGTATATGTTKAAGAAKAGRSASAASAARPASAASAARPASAASAARPAKVAAQPPLDPAAVEPADPAAAPQRAASGRKASTSSRRRLSAPKVSFTISSSGASWALSGTRGNKNLVRNVALPPGVVTAAAELFGQPALAEAVSEINDAALAEARARAEQLRSELEQLEQVLATHRRP